MKPLAIVGAVIGGVIGAIAWGGITAVTNMEIGYVATGVGFLVGYGSAMFGGRGVPNGVLCAILALLSMFGGKLATIRFMAPGEIRKVAKESPQGAQMTPAELDDAVNKAVASLTLSEMVDMTKDSLDVIDIVFAVIGVAAAFQIGVRGTHRRQPAATGYSGTVPGGPSSAPPVIGDPSVPPPPAVDHGPQSPPSPPPPGQ